MAGGSFAGMTKLRDTTVRQRGGRHKAIWKSSSECRIDRERVAFFFGVALPSLIDRPDQCFDKGGLRVACRWTGRHGGLDRDLKCAKPKQYY